MLSWGYLTPLPRSPWPAQAGSSRVVGWAVHWQQLFSVSLAQHKVLAIKAAARVIGFRMKVMESPLQVSLNLEHVPRCAKPRQVLPTQLIHSSFCNTHQVNLFIRNQVMDGECFTMDWYGIQQQCQQTGGWVDRTNSILRNGGRIKTWDRFQASMSDSQCPDVVSNTSLCLTEQK